MDCSDYVSLYNPTAEDHKDFNMMAKSKNFKPVIMNVHHFREEWDGQMKAKAKLVGNVETLYECEGGDAEKTFSKL